MKKLAIFVEGQTEQIFVEKLIGEIAGRHKVRIEKLKVSGGKRMILSFALISFDPDNDQEYYVLIMDCGNDASVISLVKDQYQSLAANGYDGIIGLRDLRPTFGVLDIPRLLDRTGKGFYYKIPPKPLTVRFVLAVMELEAWFLAEYTHFLKIDPSLTPANIKALMGFDPSIDDMESRVHPAEDLNSIYRSVGLSYKKSKTDVERTVQAIDYTRIYFDLHAVIHLRGLIVSVEAVLFGTAVS